MVSYKDLKDYRFIDAAISMAKKRLDDVSQKPMLSDKVSGSNPEYPYEQRGFRVTGINEDGLYAYQRRYDQAKREYDRLVRIKSEIEYMLSEIKNVKDRMIIQYIIDGRSQEYVARQMRMSQSRVSERIFIVCEQYQTDNSDNSDKTDKSNKNEV